MKKFVLTLLAVFMLSTPAFAGEIVKVEVNGLVCDFCARALEKVFGKQEAVENLSVDLDTKTLTVTMKDGQSLDDDTLTKLVTDSGYNIDKITRETTE